MYFTANLIVELSVRAICRVVQAVQVLKDKVVNWKCFQPPGLSSGDHFGCLEESKRLVITPNSDLLISTLYVVQPPLEDFVNGQ